MKEIDLGNNESVSIGMRKTRQGYLALTTTESKWFQTERGAAAWLRRRGYNPDGTKVQGA